MSPLTPDQIQHQPYKSNRQTIKLSKNIQGLVLFNPSKHRIFPPTSIERRIKETFTKRKFISMYYYYYYYYHVSFTTTEDFKVIHNPFSRNSCTIAEKELGEQAFVAVAARKIYN